MNWPKQVPVLSPEQTVAREQWMRLWHEVLPNRFGLIEKFNHGFPAKQFKRTPGARTRTLEVGAGLGEHAAWEDLSGQDYVMLEYREEWAEQLRARHPELTSIHGDIQAQLDSAAGSFDRVIAIHVLEHLPDLPSALREIFRLLSPGGQFDIVIPCEGGWAYEFARKISSERMFKKHFGMEYKPIIRAEHLNTCPEILEELARLPWRRTVTRYFPLEVPLWTANLCLGLQVRK
ncbi:MAG: class I SAM-dependent methyltransferase [Polyangiaceae bacterium]|jgi:SAM-dependent methyltransferase